MTNTTTHGQVPAIQRYKIGYHSDEWGVRSLSPTGIYDDAGPWVRYEDHAAQIAALRTQQPAPATQKLKEQICISDTNQSAACAAGSVGTTSDARTTRSTHDAPATQPSPEAQAADSVTAPAGPSKSLPYEPTSAMLIAARERDPALPIETVRAIYWSMWRTAPTPPAPPAPAADSVLEDAARWQWLADYLIGERTDLDEGIVACATIDALRQFADAARKQGANHE